MNLGNKQEISHLLNSVAAMAQRDININITVVDKENGVLVAKPEAPSEPVVAPAPLGTSRVTINTSDPTGDEAQLDQLLEQVQHDERTSKQKLIDQAIKIVPTLSAESLAMLTLLTFRTIVLSCDTQAYRRWLRSINSVIDVTPRITSLDIEYLQQAGCTCDVLVQKWEDICLENADLFFRHIAPEATVREFLQSIGVTYPDKIENFVVDRNRADRQQVTHFLISALITYPESQFGFKLIDSEAMDQMLRQTGAWHLREQVRTFINSCPPYTREEVASYCEHLNPNWKYAIALLDSRQAGPFKLTPVGAYIGCRQLSKLSRKDLSIDIFYK